MLTGKHLQASVQDSREICDMWYMIYEIWTIYSFSLHFTHGKSKHHQCPWHSFIKIFTILLVPATWKLLFSSHTHTLEVISALNNFFYVVPTTRIRNMASAFYPTLFFEVFLYDTISKKPMIYLYYSFKKKSHLHSNLIFRKCDLFPK